MPHARSHIVTEVRAMIGLAIPVVGSQLAQTSMGFVDTVMVGRLGPEALAGVALGHVLYFFPMILCMGVVHAVAPLVSQAYGAGDAPGLGRVVRQGLWLGVLLAVPAFFLIRNMAPLLERLGQTPVTVEHTMAYLRAVVWGFLPFLWFTALRGFAEGISRPLPVTLITFAGVLLNVGGNYVLMFGKLGFPALGLAGTGWATTLVNWFLFGALVVYARWAPAFRRYDVFRHLRAPDGTYMRRLFKLGWPIGVAYGLEVGLFAVTALLVGTFGTVPLAAHQVAIQCAAFTFMVPLGIGMAATVRVGQAIGRGEPEGVGRAGYVALVLACLFMLGTATVFWTAPEAIVSLYLDLGEPGNAAVVRLSVILLGIAAVFQLFDGAQVVLVGALRGLEDTRAPMIANFFAYWVIGLTTGYVLGFVLERGAMGLWWGLVVGLAAAAVMHQMRFAYRLRRLRGGEADLGGVDVEKRGTVLSETPAPSE